MLIAGDDCDVNTHNGTSATERMNWKEMIFENNFFFAIASCQSHAACNRNNFAAHFSEKLQLRNNNESEKEQRKEKIRVAIVLRLFCAVVKCYFASQVKSRENYYSVSRFAVSFFALCVLDVWCTRCTDDHDHRFVWNENEKTKNDGDLGDAMQTVRLREYSVWPQFASLTQFIIAVFYLSFKFFNSLDFLSRTN